MGNLIFYEGNNCTQNICGQVDDTKGQTIKGGTSELQNDEARSLKLIRVKAGLKIRIYDSPDGNRRDDWCDIIVKKNIREYCINSFEVSINDEYINMLFQKNNGLDGKVSRVEIS